MILNVGCRNLLEFLTEKDEINKREQLLLKTNGVTKGNQMIHRYIWDNRSKKSAILTLKKVMA